MSPARAMESSPFLKRVLIPFWVVRIIVMCIDIIVYGLAIGFLIALKNGAWSKEELRDRYNVHADFNVNTLLAVCIVVLVVIVACLLLDLIAIFKRARHTLTPKLFLIFNVIQTTIWTVLFVLSVTGLSSAAGLVINIVVYLSFVGLLIYASVIFHRYRKGTLNYGPETHNTPYVPNNATPTYDYSSQKPEGQQSYQQPSYA